MLLFVIIWYSSMFHMFLSYSKFFHFCFKVVKAREYQNLLESNMGRVPDPFTELTTGWQKEAEGIVHWPPIMQFDISEFLFQNSDNRELGKRLVSDYNEEKAYSYFASNFLSEVLFHPISESSELCFLKTSSTPSQKVTAVPHKVWILADKKSGRINSAYCTCFAGYVYYLYNV